MFFALKFRFFDVFADLILIELLIFSKIIHISLPMPVGEFSYHQFYFFGPFLGLFFLLNFAFLVFLLI